MTNNKSCLSTHFPMSKYRVPILRRRTTNSNQMPTIIDIRSFSEAFLPSHQPSPTQLKQSSEYLVLPLRSDHPNHWPSVNLRLLERRAIPTPKANPKIPLYLLLLHRYFGPPPTSPPSQLDIRKRPNIPEALNDPYADLSQRSLGAESPQFY